jgi:hypothetical protein
VHCLDFVRKPDTGGHMVLGGLRAKAGDKLSLTMDVARRLTAGWFGNVCRVWGPVVRRHCAD